jgi:YidC/Oxa1 family membrane protein insertase
VGNVFSFILEPLYYLISVVLVAWHTVLSPVFGADSGVTWALSIIGLTLVVRAALIPLFVKQIKSSRNMQLLQPRVKELQKKYGHDRERLAQETMNLYRETKTNPFASCLPLIVQIPIFIALFRLLDIAAKKGQGHGVLTNSMAKSFADAPIFGGRLASSFVNDGGHTGIKIVAAILVVVMVSTTFLTQRQLMSKNMPADALTGPYAQQQKLLLYILPFTFVLSGPFFPIGVIIYWTTSNIWTMGQQFYVIRNNPAPNTEAARLKEQRDAEKRTRKGQPALEEPEAEAAAVEEEQRPSTRQQPKKQSRSQRKKQPRRPQQQKSQQQKSQQDPTNDSTNEPPSDEGETRS